MVHFQKIWIMVLDCIYWVCTGGHKSTKLNYQLFRKCSMSVIVIREQDGDGDKCFCWLSFQWLYVWNIWDWHCVTECVLLKIHEILPETGSEIKFSSLILINRRFHLHGGYREMCPFYLWCRPPASCFICFPSTSHHHWLRNWLFHWGEVIWPDIGSRHVTYFADACVYVHVIWVLSTCVFKQCLCCCKHLFPIVLRSHQGRAVAGGSDEPEETVLQLQMQMMFQCKKLYAHREKFFIKVHH